MSFTALVHGAVPSDPEYLIDVWETDQGLPEDSATAMVQTPDGYLWFGTFNGLVRFDGVKFAVFDRSNTPELPSPGIVNLHLDRSGRLWVSTLLGLASVKDGNWQVYREDSGWTGNYVRFFAESASGDLYMSTFDVGRILRFRGGRFEELPPPPADSKLGFSLHVDEAGALWVVNPQFIGKFVGGKWLETIPAVNLLKLDPSGDMLSIMAGTSRDGGLWIATKQRLLKYRSGRLVFETHPPWPIESQWSLHEDLAGNVWICSDAAGLYRFSPDGRWRHFTTESGLSYHAVRFVFEDRERNLWVGTSGGGLERFKRRNLVNWGVPEGLPERVVKSIAAESNDGIMIGTWGQGVARLQGTKISRVLPAHSSKCQSFTGLVTSTLVDRKGRVWAGANGLYVVDGDTCQFVFASQGESTEIASLFEDSRGIFWVGTYDGAVNFDGNRPKMYPLEGAPRHSLVRCFAEDPRSGTLWAGNQAGGLYRLNGELFLPVPEARELANERISTLLADKAGTLWIGTEDGGIAALRKGHVTRISEKQGLPTRTIASILDDELGNLWFGSNRGILRAARAQLEELISGRKREIAFPILNQSDGMASAESSMHSQPSAVKDRDGRLWFATFRGVVAVDPKSLRLNTQPPPLAIEKVLVDGQRAEVQGQYTTSVPQAPFLFTVPPGAHRLEIHYSGLSFTAPEKVRFRYMLEGLDKDWIDVGDRRVAYLQDLKPGRYRFRVKAANNDGVWNETGAFAELYWRPHFYQTYWFYLLCALGMVFALTGTYRYNSRRLQKREQQLALTEDALQRRLRAEEGLHASEERYRSLYEGTPSMYFTVDPAGVVLSVNEFGAQQLGYTAEELVGKSVLRVFYEADKPQALAHVEECLAHPGQVFQWELRKVRKDGSLLWVKEVARTVRSPEGKQVVLIVCEDITEVRRLEDQLRQAQKMEAIGTLSGGIAHDFNNLLTVIKGYSRLVLDREQDQELRTQVERIDEAAERAATLTRQLLAFSRRQVLQPRVFNLNTLVLNMDQMLQRLIGEDIEMQTTIALDLASVKADPGQMEQVIMNLAVNARDAMPHGGKLTLETANADLDEAYAREHVGVQAGLHVMLAVSDTGMGMGAETQARIFEPFFTTKERSKGTGLGLSMVYGIVRQSGGNISVYSEPGRGSTFKIYLPRVDAPVEDITVEQRPTARMRGNETVLLVEDDPHVRELARAVLTACGYSVLVGADARTVISLCAHYADPIHLLLTDLVMPGLSGREVASQVLARRPKTKVLYMSGYTTNAVVHHGVLDANTFFLPKPFTPGSLAAKVREVLDQTPARRESV